MITGTVWGVTLFFVGFVASLVAAQVLLAAVFAARHAAARRALRQRPVGSTLLGVGTIGAALIVVSVLAQLPGVGPLAAMLFGLPAILAICLGLAATSSEVGDRLPSTGAAAAGWRGLLRGSIVVLLASFVPLAGWIVVFPLAFAAGTGALVLSAFGVGRDPAAARAAPEAPPAHATLASEGSA